MQNEWFNLTLGFADDGPDLDTVGALLDRLHGWTIQLTGVDVLVDPVNTFTADVIVDGFDQDDVDPDYPVYLTGWVYDVTRQETDFKGARVRVPLRGAHITVY